ncbi:uncharacterized protein LOC128550015 [Mercenaria mercenaria]|uniref:uncharacterized protein LOC128550015 n=1 Tax=Mercenaria mercenaria TaxID=6596 RepID=UPI00234EBEB7|nr:uncharacterized protein LOC128550015 [Mercenaria mercenaria]
MLRPTRGMGGRRRQSSREEIQRLGTEDTLKCPICLDTFETPRALACLHTFCEPCLEFYLTDCKASIKDGRLDKIECPVCGHLTLPPDVLKYPHAMVKDLPLNHFILPHLDGVTPRDSSRAESRRKRNVNFTQSCGSCAEREVATEATAYCHDCEDFQCGECVDNHSKIKMLTRHKIVTIEKVTSSSQISNSLDKHNICLVHQNEDIRFFCADHDVILCSSCAMASHKACDIINEFDDLGTQLRHDDRTDKLRDNMKGLQKALNDMVEAIRANNYGIKRETEEIPRRIQSMKAKVLRLFKYLEDETEENIKVFQEEYGKKNSDKAFKCKQLLVAIEGSNASLDTVIEHGSNHQLFLTFQKIKTQLQEYDDMVKSEKESLLCSSIQLKVEDVLDTIVNATEKLAEVRVESVKPDLAELPPLLFARKEDPVADMKPELIKSGDLKNSDANIMKTCIAATYMDKKLALIFEVKNRTWFSSSFSLVTTDKLEEIYTQDLKRDPTNIICIDSNNVAITFPNGGFIEFYLYTPKRKKKPMAFVLDHTVKCDIRDTVITKYNKTSFALSTGNYFATLTHDGVMKKVFYYSVSLRVRENDFWSTQLVVGHMVVDFKRKRIYIVSSKPDKLYSFSTKGEVIFEYNLEDTVKYLDLDKEGAIGVCSGSESFGKLFQISPNTGKILRNVAIETQNPNIACFNRKSGDFYVIENSQKKTHIEKYKFNIQEDDDLFDDD